MDAFSTAAQCPLCTVNILKGASRLQRGTGKSGKFFAQRWRTVEIKQPLTGVVGECRGSRQGAPLTPRNDSLNACARSLNVGHVGPQLFLCVTFMVYVAWTVISQ